MIVTLTKNIKNKILLFAAAFTAVILLSSCFHIPKTYKTFLDATASADKTATIIFEGDFYVKSWNGTKIYATSNVVLPAGNTNFIFNLYFTFSNQYSSTTYKFENIELQYLFEPGKKYKIKARSKSLALGFKGTEFYVELYDITKRSVKLKEWMIGKS